MINEPNIVSEREVKHSCHGRGLSWSAIILGGLIGFGLSFLLDIFGFAISLSAFTTSTDGLLTLAFGGFLGLLIGSIVTMFVSGWAAGFYARTYCFHPHFGVAYGFAAWCLAVIISIFVAGHLSQLMVSQPYLTAQSSAVMANVHNQTMQAVAQKTDLNPPASMRTAAKNTQMAAHNLGLSLFITFILLFVSALASCFGGYFGMKHSIRKGYTRHTMTEVRIK